MLNRHDWEVQTKASDLNPTARLIALVLGAFGNWKEAKTVEPGESRIAKEAGLDPSTVADYMDEFVRQGWLKPVGKGRYNTTIYELCQVDTPATGLLAKTKRKVNRNSVNNLRKGTAKVVPDSTENLSGMKVLGSSRTDRELDEVQLPKPQTVVPDTTEFSSRYEPGKFPNVSGVVPGTTETNHKNHTNNLEEPSTSTSADAPVGKYHFIIRETGQSFLNTESEGTPVYVMDLDGVTGPLNTTSRDAADFKRILTPGEKKTYDDLVRIHRVEKKKAVEALRIIEAGNPRVDISKAVSDALVSVGAVPAEAVEVW